MFYDEGRFLQWLEGPAGKLAIVADAIGRDERHTDIELLRYGTVPARMYSGWSMRLATRKPEGAKSKALKDLDGDLAPAIAARELAEGNEGTARALFGLAPATAAGAAAQCEKIAAAYGPLWRSDEIRQAEIVIGLSHVLRLFRERTARLAPTLGALAIRVLVAAPPGEPHFLGAAFAAEVLREQGFIVDYLLPNSEDDLLERCAALPFEAAVLATSPVFSSAERSSQLTRLAAQMGEAHAGGDFAVTVYGKAPASLCGPDIRQVTARAAEIGPQHATLAHARALAIDSRRILH